MIPRELSNHILSIGCAYNPPKGGVAQVIYTYSKEVYPVFRCITNSSGGGKLKNLIHAAWALINVFFVLLLNRDIKIVHIHTASYISFKRSAIFVRVAIFLKRKVVLHIHGGGFKEFFMTNPKWIKSIMQECDAVIALTESWKSFYKEEIGLQSVYVVNNIIPSPQIDIIDKKDGMIHLLFLGLINDAKGIFDLLEVIKENRDKWENKLLLHVGGNGEVDRMLRFIADNNIGDLVKYEGWVSGERKVELLNIMDVFILPSYVEGLPISILEALSYGKAVISTNVGGIPEIINENNGFLFYPGHKDELGVLINLIVQNPKYIDTKISYTRRSVLKNLPEEVSKQLTVVYNNITNGTC